MMIFFESGVLFFYFFSYICYLLCKITQNVNACTNAAGKSFLDLFVV